MKLKDILNEMTRAQLDRVEDVVNALWKELDVDITFSHHFFTRLNDPRENPQPITPKELITLFLKQYRAHGYEIANYDSGKEAVLTDIVSRLNIPFVVNDHGRDREIKMKTVRRRPDFYTPDQTFVVR